MLTLAQQILLSAPLFILVFVGYAAMKFFAWPASMSEAIWHKPGLAHSCH